MRADWTACAEQVQRADPDRFLSAMTARPDQRGPLMVLYAFNLEVARAPWVTKEPLIAEMRLQWWRDAIAEVFEGREVRRHEVVTPLGEVIHGHKLPRAPSTWHLCSGYCMSRDGQKRHAFLVRWAKGAEH